MAISTSTAYTIARSPLNGTDGTSATSQISVLANNLNVDTTLSLVGKDLINYGEAIAQNSVKLLENFASDTAPVTPTEGQLWWDTTSNSEALKIWHITTAGTTGKWLSLHSTQSGSNVITLLDDATPPGEHTVVVHSANGIPVSITSSDASFNINSTDTTMATYYSNFTNNGAGTGDATINQGINLNTVTARSMKFHGTATYAQYADVAELYTSDVEHAPGTVVILCDSEHDVTDAKNELDSEVLGIVTTDPALLMNSMLQGTTVGVALLGRVPCNVTGIIKKGDRIISSNLPGHGQSVDAVNEYSWQHVIGRALESKTTLGPGTIEVIVGVK